MDISFKSKFLDAAYNCEKCYEKNKDKNSKDADFKAFANDSLSQIIKLCEEKNIEHIIADGAQKSCKECYYRDPNIKNHLESYGIKII